MNPIYRFTLSANGGAERAAFPVYRDDVSKDFEQQSNEEFYRAKLAGKLTFVRDDYDFIASQTFDTEFGIKIYISYDAGQTWTEYWAGNFWKTNCTFNDDDKNVTLTPDVVDQYTDVLAGLEKEYNLIELAPEIQMVKFDKRPMVQVYVPGDSVIGCFMAGMWWEQECEPVSNVNLLTQTGNGKLNFTLNKSLRVAEISGSMSPQLPDIITGTNISNTLWTISGGGYSLMYGEDTSDPEDEFTFYAITRISDGVRLWFAKRSNGYEYPPQNVVLNPVSGSGATGTVTLYIHDMKVYTRVILDVPQIGSQPTYTIGPDDMVGDNRNYSRVVAYGLTDVIFFSSELSETPTQWGIYQPGKYYQPPYLYWNPEIWPVARSAWGHISIWYTTSSFDILMDELGRAEYTLRDAYPIASVISVLLGKIAPGITHQHTSEYSKFLYGSNPLLNINQHLFITPKSNIIASGYDQPAQKAPITLKGVMDMLRDCFRCYWFIDDQNRFRIEHITFFMNGGAYPGTPNFPVIGRDLTIEQITRNGKKLDFGTSKFQFDKPEMASRYQFGWMDNETQLFDGFPIDIISKYVNPENIEQIDISQFSSDIDYILLNPADISKDGFVLLAAIEKNEISTTETYNIYDSLIISFRYPVPSNWRGKKLRIIANVTNGTTDEPVYLNVDTQTSQDFVALYPGNNTVEINVPNDAIQLAFESYVDSVVVVTFVGLGDYKLPYYNFNYNNTDHIIQNAYVAFAWLQQYYAYDMPARYYSINGEQMQAQGIKKLKTQTLNFPVLTDPDMLQLVKTKLGNGTIQKMSVNLSSRNAKTTLKYDTE